MVIKDTIYYEPAAEDRMLHIYLPDDYDSSGERYPVMYFWDGHNLFFDSDATYGKSWGLVQFLSSWSQKLIVVGIECSHQGSHRLDEYCPYDSELMGTQIHGEGWETMEWMTGVLKPYIDGKFRTLPSRESTAIGGASMGGLMSLYAVTRYNHVYSRAACLSSSIFMVQDPLRRDITASWIDPDTRIYLSWGEKETGDDPHSPFAEFVSHVNHDMQALLVSKGAFTSLYLQADGRHCEADWEKQLPIFMNYLWL